MARLQGLKQERFLETSVAPLTGTQVIGGSSGVPKFHPLKGSNPVFKASNLVHSVRLKKPKLMKMPRMTGY